MVRGGGARRSRAGRCSPPSTARCSTNSTRPSRAKAPSSTASRWPSPIRTSLDGARIAGNRKALSGLAHLGITADPSGALPLQLRLAYVAAGRLDGAVSIGNRNDWDLAAGELLVIEAGGSVSGASGEGYIYNRPEPWQQGLVAAGAKRHAAIIEP